MQRSRFWLAAVALLAVFVCQRAALLLTSLDANRNWEEPVFAFSAGELARDGLGRLFDHQDDLRHGGSLPLILIGVAVFRFVGGDLRLFKGIALVWSALTLLACMAIGRRYFSPGVGLLWGVFYTAASGASARLEVTLVGSHPEALLPSAAAIACYLEELRRGPARRAGAAWLPLLFGVACAAAVWFAYVSLVFVAPLLVCWLLARPRPRALAAFASGALLGALPWLVQNLWLRPAGGAFALVGGEPWLWSGLVSSFGSGDREDLRRPVLQGLGMLALCGAGFVLLLRRAWVAPRAERLALAPFLAAAPLGLLLFALAKPPFQPWDGYYALRFFAPLQAALYWVLALGLALGLPASLRRALPAFGLLVLAEGLIAQAGLLGRGSGLPTDWGSIRVAGCGVFGAAEAHRSPGPASAAGRLAGLSGPRCRETALAGLGAELLHMDVGREEVLRLRRAGPEVWPPLCWGYNRAAAPEDRLECAAPAARDRPGAVRSGV
jgi:hypothetical protein